MPSDNKDLALARCEHIKIDGVRCGSPALRGARHCYFHRAWQPYRPTVADRHISVVYDPGHTPPAEGYHLPLLEDANSVQLAIFNTLRELRSGAINHKTAALMLYGLQIATHNLKQVDLEPLWEDAVVQEHPPLSAEEYEGSDDEDDEDAEGDEAAAEPAAAPAPQDDSLAATLLRALNAPEPAPTPEKMPDPEVTRAHIARIVKEAHEKVVARAEGRECG